jgi:hypothetical protein
VPKSVVVGVKLGHFCQTTSFADRFLATRKASSTALAAEGLILSQAASVWMQIHCPGKKESQPSRESHSFPGRALAASGAIQKDRAQVAASKPTAVPLCQ